MPRGGGECLRQGQALFVREEVSGQRGEVVRACVHVTGLARAGELENEDGPAPLPDGLAGRDSRYCAVHGRAYGE